MKYIRCDFKRIASFLLLAILPAFIVSCDKDKPNNISAFFGLAGAGSTTQIEDAPGTEQGAALTSKSGGPQYGKFGGKSSALTTGANIGGSVIITGDDADDNYHCQGTNCGSFYIKAINESLDYAAQNGLPRRILAVGVHANNVAYNGFNSWNNHPTGANAPVDYADTPAKIQNANFSDYGLVYIASSYRMTRGGLTQSEVNALGDRGVDLTAYINVHGGSLISLSMVGLTNAWRWLPVPLTVYEPRYMFDTVTVTPDMTEFSTTTTSANLSHCCFHNVFLPNTDPSVPESQKFGGLKVLAVYTDPINDSTAMNQPVYLGGRGVKVTAEICTNGTDDDQDGLIDRDDPDCQICGDGYLDTPQEQCDDNNNANGDGCSATCQSEDPDGDLDGIPDSQDNCPGVSNPGQEDTDGDGIGDACDNCQDTDLIKNGSFEEEVVTHARHFDVYNTQQLSGWVVEWVDKSGSCNKATGPILARPVVELQSYRMGNSDAVDGNQYAELDSDCQGPDYVGGGREQTLIRLAQVLETKPGSTYEVSYWLKKRDQLSHLDNPTISVYWDGNLVRPGTGLPADWTKYTHTLTATGKRTVIEFIGGGLSDGMGPLLDQVKVVGCAADCPTTITRQEVGNSVSDPGVHDGGDDHGIWISPMGGHGLVGFFCDNRTTKFNMNPGSHFDEYANGTAHLVGTATVATGAYSRNGEVWLVDVWFDQRPSGVTPQLELNAGANQSSYTSGWRYYGMRANSATLTQVAGIANATLTPRPGDFSMAFQVGVSANGKNLNFGGSGGFYFQHNTARNRVRNGIGSFNIDMNKICPIP